jgi:YVTN family beta-propeller protein
VIASGTNTVVATVTLPGLASSPFGVAVTPDGKSVYVTSSGDNTVYVIATASKSILTSVPVGPGPRGVAVTPDGARVYVTNENGDSVSVIATATNSVIATVPLPAGSQPIGVAVTPDGTNVYVADLGNTPGHSTASVIATATNTVVATVPVGTNPVAFGKFIGGKPDPLLKVPQWFQYGIPAFDSNGNPMSGNGYPNFWATLHYDFDVTPNSTIGRYGCALTALTMVFNFLNGITTTPTCQWTSLTNPPTCAWPGLPPSDPKNPGNAQWPNNWRDLFQWSQPGMNGVSKGLVEWNNWRLWVVAQQVRVYRECTPIESGTSCAGNKFQVLPKGSQPTITNRLSLYTLNTATQTLVNLLRNGVPLILPILNDAGQEKHWVVVKGFNSKASPPLAQFLINDPGDGDGFNVKTLNDVPNAKYASGDHISLTSVTTSLQHFDGWKVYVLIGKTLIVADPNTPQSLGVYSGDPVEFVLTDPLGHRTGFDPVSNTPFQEIPSSDYSTSVYSDEQDFSFVKPPFKALDMANQVPGQYTLNVIGTASSSFTIEVRSSDAAGNFIIQTYSGITALGVSSRFTFQGAPTKFGAFSANVAINNSLPEFNASGQFTLGTGSSGINPLTQPVTLQVGTFLITIPPGSFQLDNQGNYVFHATLNGVPLNATIQPLGGSQYAYGIKGDSAANLPTANPVDIRLAIGSDGGDTSVSATFLP